MPYRTHAHAGTPETTMSFAEDFDDVVADVVRELEEAVKRAPWHVVYRGMQFSSILGWKLWEEGP